MHAFAMQEPVVSEGTLRTPEGRVLPLEHTAVSATIVGPVATVEVVQRFRNDTGGAIEAVYLFPLPHEASVHRMSFRIGARVVQAVVKEREEARRVYEAARSEGRSATLLEQERPNLFTLSVANIPAGEAIEVTLGYQERLAYDEGEWRLVFPLVAAERYSPGAPVGSPGKDGAVPTAEVPDAARIRPPRLRRSERGSEVSIEVEVRAGRAIEPPRSPSHRILCDVLGEDAYKVRLSQNDAVPNRDFVLAYRVAREGVRAEVLFERRPEATGTFLLVLTPSASPLPDAEETSAEGRAKVEGRSFRCDNCGAALADLGAIRDFPLVGPGFRCEFCGTIVSTRELKARIALPRDVCFLVDRSASMRGGALAQARRAVAGILARLGARDAVQLFAFDHERLAADGAGERWLANDASTRRQLDAFLEGLAPRGGSELEEAIERACKLEARSGRTRLVVMLSDGAVGNEVRLFKRAPKLLGAQTRLYVLGVGPAVNRYLVERLARAGGGASDVLLPGEEPDAIVERFARRVRQAGPVLSGLKLGWDDALPVDVYPSPIPDLFGGQTVQLLGRFAGTGASRLVLTGTRADGEPFRQEVEVALPESSSACPGLERLWARLRIDARLERLAREPGELSEIRMEVLGLALKHSLLSPYTALVAEDSEKRVDGPARRVEVPVEELGAVSTRAGVAQPAPRPAPSGPPGAFPAPPAPMMAMASPAPARARRSMIAEESYSAKAELAELEASSAIADLDEHAVTRSGTVGGFAGAPPPSTVLPTAPTAPRRAGGVLGWVSRLLGGGGEDGPVDVEPGVEGGLPLQVPGSEPYSQEQLEYAARKAVGELDLVFLVDETGSMGAYIEEVKRRLLQIIEALRAAPLCRSLRLGLVSYRDHPPQDTSFVSRVVPLSDDVKAIRAGVGRMHANGGGDGPEAVTDGLYDLVRLDWRPNAARVVVWVGDAPPHGIGCHGDGFPDGCPCGHHWFTQAESCREMGVVVHAVGCIPGLHSFPGAEEVFQTVAKATRGLYVPLSEAPLLIPLITGVAESELDKQRIQERIAEALARHEQVLAPADDQERVRYLTEVLRAENLRPRGLAAGAAGPAPLLFRELAEADVEEGIDRLRRLGRTVL
jgi:Ca-activated chloride channel family protein